MKKIRPNNLLRAIKNKVKVQQYMRNNEDKTIKEIIEEFNSKEKLTDEEAAVLAFLVDKGYVGVKKEC